MSTTLRERPIGLTMGDPAGIGPEIVVQCFRRGAARARECVVFGTADALRRAQASILQRLDGGMPLPIVELEDVAALGQVPEACVPVVSPYGAMPDLPAWGQASAHGGALAARCIEAAVAACLDGHLRAITTAPIHKEAFAAAGVAFPGHTEMLQALAARHRQVPAADMPVRMMLANGELRTVLCTVHMALRDAIASLSELNVFATIRITNAALEPVLGRPVRIAVAALNPHAGEGGLFGREEIEFIRPAIERARDLGLDVSGPWPPDTVFMSARGRPDFADVVVAMYHDQGLIPVKYLGLDEGVNVTLGLPFVRTSPDHGTAFDIAGRGIADPASMGRALDMARALTSGGRRPAVVS